MTENHDLLGSDTPPSTIIVSGEFPPDLGGTATVAGELHDVLFSAGGKVRVISLGDFDRVDRDGRTTRFPRRWGWARRTLRIARQLRRNRDRFDVIVAFSLHEAAVLGAKLARLPVVIFVPADQVWERARRRRLTTSSFERFQDQPSKDVRVWSMRTLRRVALSNADQLLVPSEVMRRWVARWSPGAEIGVLHPVIRPVDERPPGRRRPVSEPLRLAFAGRLAGIKRVELILWSMRGLSDVEIVILGDGPERRRLEATAETLGIRARFRGAVPHEEVLREFEQADLLVLASDFESFGNVIVEAISVGTPVLAPATGGIPEACAGGGCWLMDEASTEEIRRAILRLRDDSDTLAHLKAAAANSHGPTADDAFTVKEIDLLLRQVVDGRSSGTKTGRS